MGSLCGCANQRCPSVPDHPPNLPRSGSPSKQAKGAVGSAADTASSKAGEAKESIRGGAERAADTAGAKAGQAQAAAGAWGLH